MYKTDKTHTRTALSLSISLGVKCFWCDGGVCALSRAIQTINIVYRLIFTLSFISLCSVVLCVLGANARARSRSTLS